MKMKVATALSFLLLTACPTRSSEIIKFRLFDGEVVEGKLSLPATNGKIRELVIYIHGTGPGTYDNHRRFGKLDLNYFDYFASEFNRRGIAFFTYNKRGVTNGDIPPMFDNVDREKFRSAVPSIEVRDISTFIRTLQKDQRLRSAKMVLLGWSEGTVLAAMAAENKRNHVSALFLNGYVNENMSDVIKWQNTGGSAMVNLRGFFDKDKNGSISRGEYGSDDKAAASMRARLGNVEFERLDVNKDDSISADDFAMLQKSRYQAILDAIERGDNDWIWNNYFRISIAWLKEHFALERNSDRLMRLKIPIYIFHGEDDANCPVEGVYEVRKRFDQAGKKNLYEYVFPEHDHNLNFVDWVLNKKMPAGIVKMFETAEALNN